MPLSYQIAEPHPSVTSSRYMYAGRGGAGNFSHVNPKKVTSGPDATGPASRTTLTKTQSQSSPPPSSSSFGADNNPPKDYQSRGRGGAGNMHFGAYYPERPIFSFDEELERQRKMLENMVPYVHIGRGGAGNSYGSSVSATSATSAPVPVPVVERRNSEWSGSSTGSSAGSGVSGKAAAGNGWSDAWTRLKDGLLK